LLRGGQNPTADQAKRRFANRGLAENWPYFGKIGGWQGLAKHVRTSRYTVGVAEWREDGWVALHANERAVVTTKQFTNADRLAINACTAAGGSIRIEVLDAGGGDMPGYCGANAARFEGDSTRADVAWQDGGLRKLPDGVFRLRITLQKADLYALYW